MQLTTGVILGPYKIISQIGTGGMGTVWKAIDMRLDRAVAIKQLQHSQCDRIKQEARATAALNHPHICQIFDIGEDFLVLEYIEGNAATGPFPLAEALQLAVHVSRALEEAHRAGILHRDLKPANILISAKGAKLLDFGIAKQQAAPDPNATCTSDLQIAGTPAYMSPEQALGRPLDERSDIFSLGAVLYEWLSGTRAFSGDSMLETLNAVVHAHPRRLDSPAAALVERCLAKEPSLRFPNAAALSEALIDLLRTIQDAQHTVPTASAVRSQQTAHRTIAVLPLINMSSDQENEYICDGISEELINGLTQIRTLRVVSRSSSFRCKGTTPDIRAIGQQLRCDVLLHGSLRKSGDRLRLTMQLSETEQGYQIWSQRFDAQLRDLFELQDQLTASVLERLRELLGISATQVETPGRPIRETSAQAHQLYLQARYAFHQETTATFRSALDLLHRAVAIDPDYAPAWFGIAETNMRLVWYGQQSAVVGITAARGALEAGFRLEPNSALGLHLLATIEAAFNWNWPQAAATFQRALHNGSGLPGVHVQYALDYLTPNGRLEEALRSIEHALNLDPLSPLTSTALGGCYYRMHLWKESAAILRKTLQQHPGFCHAHWSLGRTLVELGEYEEAIQHFESAVQITNDSSPALAELAYALGRSAVRTGEAKGILDQLLNRNRRDYVSPVHLALVACGLGDRMQTMQWLEQAFTERVWQLIWIPVDPRFAALHEDKGFQDLISRLGLPLPAKH